VGGGKRGVIFPSKNGQFFQKNVKSCEKKGSPRKGENG
jgi:hypothetical protein